MKMKIAVAGMGYVGLSLAVLLAQKHEVTAVDIVPEKVDLINQRISPIKDEYIEKYLLKRAYGDLGFSGPRGTVASGVKGKIANRFHLLRYICSVVPGCLKDCDEKYCGMFRLRERTL